MAAQVMTGKIKEWVDAQPEEKQELILEVRKVILGSNKKITEDIKWRALTFFSDEIIASIFIYRSTPYINLGFARATELDDPNKLLEGTGKGMRHLKINTKKEIASYKEQIAQWINQAAQLPPQKRVRARPAKSEQPDKSQTRSSVRNKVSQSKKSTLQ